MPVRSAGEDWRLRIRSIAPYCTRTNFRVRVHVVRCSNVVRMWQGMLLKHGGPTSWNIRGADPHSGVAPTSEPGDASACEQTHGRV